MHKVLRKIALTLICGSLACCLVSCDDEDQPALDYKYDGLTAVSAPNMDLAEAKKLQRSGKIEDVTLEKATVMDDMQADMPVDDMAVEEETSTDPNFM